MFLKLNILNSKQLQSGIQKVTSICIMYMYMEIASDKEEQVQYSQSFDVDAIWRLFDFLVDYHWSALKSQWSSDRWKKRKALTNEA